MDLTAPLKIPPQSVEAEQSVLGGLLLDNDAWDKIADVINEADFYRDDHRRIYRHINNLFKNNKPADAVTVSESLAQNNELQAIGGLAYLGSLVQNVPSAANIRRYAEIVRDRAVMRKLVEIGSNMADSAFNPQGKAAADLLEEAETRVFEIAEQGARGQKGFLGMPELLEDAVAQIEKLYSRENASDVTGVATGFVDLDKQTSGFHGGDLVIVAGRPSMGKTAFALNIAEHVAVREKLPVGVFSMEMGGTQLVMRMISSVGRLDQKRLRTGGLDDEDWNGLTYAVGQLNEAPLFIDETPGLNVTDLRARARRLARQCGGQLGLIVIDYLQLMSGTKSQSGGSDNRTQEVSEISRSLKALAKELRCPVVALSQLNRGVESRQDKRPMMSDLRESGAIEQDADLIIFMYRDEYYNEDSPDKGMAEAIIGKQRNGPTGKVRLVFRGEFTRFENYSGGAGFVGGD